VRRRLRGVAHRGGQSATMIQYVCTRTIWGVRSPVGGKNSVVSAGCADHDASRSQCRQMPQGW
jgi:hypothetical protein